jgi:RND family efflux transporter MFP subunit
MKILKRNKRTVKILLIGMMALLLNACAEEEAPPIDVLRTVQYQIISPSEVANQRIFSGTVRSSQQSRLSFKVGGNISELPVKVGDKLKKDQLIARLDASTYELQAEQSRASLAQIKAAERNAASVFQRTKSLYENNNASRTDLDSARANSESAIAQSRAAGKALALARLNVQYTRLLSPFDCVVASVEAELNENVTSGSAIITADCGDELEVVIAIPDSLISKIEKVQPVNLKFDSIEDKNFSGKIDKIGVAVSGNGSTFPVTITVVDPDGLLRPGLAAEVSLQFANDNALDIYLPASAVNGDSEGSYIFIAEPSVENQAFVRKRRIAVDGLTSNGLKVTSGIRPGEYVITAGIKTIRPGMTVLLSK